ncbi:MAG TPA: hypothetical protein DDW93_12955 [Firmicutes bacterium]|nr:hypothetical protein [Bacillota bacterium]
MKLLSKFLIVVVLTCLLAGPAFARDEVLISEQIDHGGFGGPSFKVTSLNGKTGVLTGGYGGWYINHTFMIGGGGYGLANEVKAPVTDTDGDLYYNLGYGGLMFEYVNNSHKLIHFTINTLIGAGGIGYRERNWRPDPEYASDLFFVFEPTINLELNVASCFRVGLGVSYRYIDGIQLVGTTDEELSGIAANLNFKFGAF